MEIEKLLQMAEQFGFNYSAELNTATLIPMQEVRDMCAADKCRSYAKNWKCPPACGTLEENIELLKKYKNGGVIVQTCAEMEDDYDYETMQEAGQAHSENFLKMYTQLRREVSGVLALGAGACTLCESCAYPDKPCRRPEQAVTSMEAFGLWVSDVCTKNNIAYNHGVRTITYTSCFLLP